MTHQNGRVTTVGNENGCAGACTRFPLAAVSVDGRIGAVEVHVLVAHEATVSVLGPQVSLRDRIPCVTHSLLDVGSGERRAVQNALPEHVKE